jgi:hypothetical protein
MLFFRLNKLNAKSPIIDVAIATLINTKAIHHQPELPGPTCFSYVHCIPKTETCKLYFSPKPYKYKTRNEIRKATRTPPIKPSHVFFGDNTGAILCLPKNIPAK